MKALKRLWQEDAGQDLTEYALMAAFLAAASGFTLPQIASSISTVLTTVIGMLAGSGSDSVPVG